MTIDQLIARLEECRDEIGGDAEVRLMTQRNWPFENSIFGVTTGAEMNESDDDDDDDDAEDAEDAEDDGVVYIVENEQLGYGSKRAWNCAF
jgi:hypothetical protein